MKTSTVLKPTQRFAISICLLMLSVSISNVFAQETLRLTGILMEAETNQPLEFAHVAAFDSEGSVFITGTVTNLFGEFTLDGIPRAAKTVLRFSSIGFETLFVEIITHNEEHFDVGQIQLASAILSHDDVIVYGEQVRARVGVGKTSFYVSERLTQTVGTGIELIRYIPGIHLDFNRNIHLYGNSEVVLLIDGIKRDPSFLNQLDASEIAQVEIYTTPPPQFSGISGGVIEIITKRKNQSHLSGHVNADLPTRASEIYSFPSAGLSFGRNNLHLMTSYSGEFSFFDLVESYRINGNTNSGNMHLISNQTLRQEYWSHRFHFGGGLRFSPSAHVNYYGWVNPFAQEFSGIVKNNSGETFQRSDEDKNLSHFHALNSQFNLNSTGSLTLYADLSFFTLNSENSSTFTNMETDGTHQHIQKINHQSVEFKPSIKGSLGESTEFETGGIVSRAMYDTFSDAHPKFKMHTMAGFGTLTHVMGSVHVSGGLRAEYHTHDASVKVDDRLFFAPQLSVMYRHLVSATAIRATWAKHVQRPHIFELLPTSFVQFPGSEQVGNPSLNPEIRNQFKLEISKNSGNNFYMASLFYTQNTDVIGRISQLSSEGNFESRYLNSGRMIQYGAAFSGSLQLWKQSGIQPYLRVGRYQSTPSASIDEDALSAKRGYVFQFGMSAYQHIGNNLTVSFLFNYEHPVYMMQRTRYHDALYFVGLDYRFKNGIQVGFKSGIPFSKSFTYDAMNITQESLNATYRGNIQKSSVPVWLTLSYRFSKGLQRDLPKTTESPSTLRRGGF